jgi:hypothetical protein
MHLSQLRTQQFHAVQKYTKIVHFSPQGISMSVADANFSFEIQSFNFTHPLCKTSLPKFQFWKHQYFNAI